MSVKLSQLPPDPNTIDWNNPQSIKDWILQAHLCIDELSRKAKSQQIEVRSDAPDTNSVEEGEDVRYVSGATIRTYTKISGTVRYHAET